MSLALYVHIPFCQKKCYYCDFASRADSGVTPEEYVDAVTREMELRAALLAGPATAETLYIGGGTPSMLSPSLVKRLIDGARQFYRLAAVTEITLEANPGTVTLEGLAGYRDAGVNRLSLGVQSFDDRFLALLGRVHTAGEAWEAFAAARRAGFENLGIDLIHSLPGQTPEQWREELEQAVVLRPEHVSAYGLTVEEGTTFHRLREEGTLLLPDDDDSATMFRMTAEVLCTAGYEQYEIANFALPGRRSRHNQVYWRRGNYLGFGAAAHSFRDSPPLPAGSGVLFPHGRRWHNPSDPARYLSSVSAGRLPEEGVTVVSRRDAMTETLFLGLRMAEGIDREEFRSTFGEEIEAVFGPEVVSLLDVGLLRCVGNRIFIPADKLVLSNRIVVSFL